MASLTYSTNACSVPGTVLDTVNTTVKWRCFLPPRHFLYSGILNQGPSPEGHQEGRNSKMWTEGISTTIVFLLIIKTQKHWHTFITNPVPNLCLCVRLECKGRLNTEWSQEPGCIENNSITWLETKEWQASKLTAGFMGISGQPCFLTSTFVSSCIHSQTSHSMVLVRKYGLCHYKASVGLAATML